MLENAVFELLKGKGGKNSSSFMLSSTVGDGIQTYRFKSEKRSFSLEFELTEIVAHIRDALRGVYNGGDLRVANRTDNYLSGDLGCLKYEFRTYTDPKRSMDNMVRSFLIDLYHAIARCSLY